MLILHHFLYPYVSLMAVHTQCFVSSDLRTQIFRFRFLYWYSVNTSRINCWRKITSKILIYTQKKSQFILNQVKSVGCKWLLNNEQWNEITDDDFNPKFKIWVHHSKTLVSVQFLCDVSFLSLFFPFTVLKN